MIKKHVVIRFVRHWHARLGVLAALFFLFLAITGVALNHTEALSLAKTNLDNPLLMRWYGLHAEIPDSGFKTNLGFVVNVEGAWVLGARQLPVSDTTIQGAVDWQGMLAIISQHALYLVNPEGRLVDTLSKEALPAPDLIKLGVNGDQLVLATKTGIYTTDDAIGWSASKQGDITWATAIHLKQAYQDELSKNFRPSLPLERIMLDIHSGRIFGQYGPLLMDLVAIALSTLAISGVWIYLRSIRRQKSK